ncbi:hypothetical protein Bca52824_096584 [Brassica carinata]|uniref:beta-galactosidase n=1 Tax=Brassica carinata TaxID=52824 RepID=A0A8X7NZ04_BRACI|nr:hypothetical protein Bca52824_096584 [Brassica carinata]
MWDMRTKDSTPRLILWLCLGFLILGVGFVQCGVTYDRKALLINGQRRILFSGSIHYPRSTPDMWEGLIQKAKDGGVDVIETYVFWNLHEPSPGKDVPPYAPQTLKPRDHHSLKNKTVITNVKSLDATRVAPPSPRSTRIATEHGASSITFLLIKRYSLRVVSHVLSNLTCL